MISVNLIYLRHLVEILILSHSSCVDNIIPDCGSTNIFSANSAIFRYRAGAPESRLPGGADIEKRTESKIEKRIEVDLDLSSSEIL